MVPRVPTRDSERGLPEALSLLLLGATTLRLLGSVVAGLDMLTRDMADFAPASQRTGSILSTFGSAGDTVSALLLLGVVALLAWGRPRPRVHLLMRIVRVLLFVTAVLVVVRIVGTYAIDAQLSGGTGAQEAVVTGFGLGDLLLCLGGAVMPGRLDSATATTAVGAADDLEPEPLVFAVDRGNGEVFAFFSYAQAARTIGVYSIEEDEFAFYTDDGTLLQATVVGERTRFTPTEEDRRSELMAALRAFARAKSLVVAEPDEPTAYAVPISDWQWLELWPGWLRGIGRMVRRFQA
jgi:hypothetical protein